MNNDQTPHTTGEGYQLLQEQAREAGTPLGEPQAATQQTAVLPETGIEFELIAESLLPALLVLIIVLGIRSWVRHARDRRLE